MDQSEIMAIGEEAAFDSRMKRSLTLSLEGKSCENIQKVWSEYETNSTGRQSSVIPE